ncbi:MAG: HD domain-containing protein [Candidatus Micrarchaeaceae archaeon]
MHLSAEKRINDSIYGSVSLTRQELKLIDTPIFQRLHQIKQLGPAYYVYPGATHTRFAHSIGTMHLTSQFFSALKKSAGGAAAGGYDLEKLRIAALLHDLGHAPYSHTAEKAILKLGGMSHEEFGAHLVKNFMADRIETYKPSEISALFSGKAGTSVLISSALDADKADYLIRDSYNTGVPYGRVSIQRLIRTISYTKNGILFEKDEIAAEDFLIGRYHMYRAVYQHKTVTSFSLMFEKIFENLAVEGYLPHPKDLVKEQDEYVLAGYTDNMVLSSMQDYLKSGTDQFTKRLIRLFLGREPLECIYQNPQPSSRGKIPKDVSLIKKLESETERASLAEAAGLSEEEIFPAIMRPLSLIEDKTNVYVNVNGKQKPITESKGLVLNMIGSKTLYEARVYAMPGSGKRLSIALGRYLSSG